MNYYLINANICYYNEKNRPKLIFSTILPKSINLIIPLLQHQALRAKFTFFSHTKPNKTRIKKTQKIPSLCL